MEKITNTFNGGLNKDTYISIGDNNDYRYATNVISSDDKQNTWLTNEHSTVKHVEYSKPIVGKRHIAQIDSTIVFLEGGEIHLFNHNTKTSKFVASASELGCDLGMNACEEIKIYNYYQYINDLWLTYSSNKIYYNLNLTELLDPTRKAGLITSLSTGCGEGCSQRTCEYFRTFKKSCDPHITAIPLEGGTLRNGTYFVGGRYKNNQGGYSNPFIMTPAIPIGGNNNRPGEISNKRLEVTVQNTSCSFDQIEFFIHEIIDGKTLTKAFPVQYITGNWFTIQYTGSENMVPIDVSELLINSRTYIEGEDLTIIDNRALYYRTTPEFEYNFQSIANQIQVDIVAVKVPLQDVKKYQLKSFLRGETYALSITPNYTSGKKGYGFHIPAIPSAGNCASFPYQDPLDYSHLKASKNTPSSATSSGECFLGSTGCETGSTQSYFIDTDNFCNCTKIYLDKEKTKLCPATNFSFNSSGDTFVRNWDGDKFTNGCNVCISSEGSGSGSGNNKKLTKTGSTSPGSVSKFTINQGLLYKRIRSEIPSTVNNPTEEGYTNFVKGVVDSWQTTNKDILDAIAPACLPGGCDNGCIEEVGGGHCGGGSGSSSSSSSSSTPKPRSSDTTSSFYKAESCSNSTYKIVVASSDTNLVGKSIIVSGECFKVLSVDATQSSFLYGEKVYSSCNECKAFTGNNQSLSGSSSSSSSGGGCGGGCKSCSGGNCVNGQCYPPKETTVTKDGSGTVISTSETTKEGSEDNSEITNEINSFCNVRNDQKNANIGAKDSANAEELGAMWFNALSNYINETKKPADNNHSVSDNTVEGSSPANLLTNPVEGIKELRKAASNLIDSIKNRERFYYDYKPFEVNKSASFSSDTLDPTFNHNDTKTQAKGKIPGGDTSYNDKEIQISDSIYKKYPVVGRFKTKPKVESNTYPCIVDCYGNQIYCGLGGTNVTHHTMVTNAESPFWIPKGGGDGSIYENDSSILNGYAVLLGLEFSNINVPEILKPYLCESNPFTIGIVKRDSSNSSMVLKGMGTEAYSGPNQGKRYLHFKYSMNSREKVSKYIDSDGKGRRMGGTEDNLDNIGIYSLDQLVRSPYLNGTHIIREGTMRATGSRVALFSQGFVSNDNRARRKDRGGSIHTMTVGDFTPSDTRIPISGQTYVPANEALSPPTGGSIPFMNKHGQSFAWIVANGVGQGYNDNSFVGDVLQHQAPITDAIADYYSIFRELESQYGDITSLNYSPLVQARGFDNSIRTFDGDSYIGPYSYVKTGYVSDKVGNYFPIGNMVPGKTDRCICDDPNDAIHSVTGNWYWKQLPIQGDAADAKNWAGTHTTTVSKTWSEAQGTDTESHYYYPATTKAAIMYVGESEANPWLREKSDLLQEQWLPELKPIFNIHSHSGQGANPDDCYLEQHNKVIEQASTTQLALKVLIQSFIKLALPVLGINDWLNPETGIEFAGDMLNAVIQMAVYLLVTQVLFTNDFIDKFLRLDPCNRDEQGGERQFIENWFENYSSYNNDYSIDYFYPTIKGLPLEYTGCISKDSVTNTIYISDENDTSYYVNGYKVVRPNSKIMLDESYGKLTAIYYMNKTIYMHTTDGIYASRMGNIQVPTNMGDLLLGSNNMISTPTLITNSAPEGMYGLQHPNHGRMTPFGFIFVDSNGKDLILYNGSSFDILSSPNYKMNTFFNKYLDFCTKADCCFENKQDTPNYIFGVDQRHNRILFSKIDGEFSYTMSFDLLNKRWRSFHSYKPQDYFQDRHQLYSINSNSIYSHSDYKTYSTFYDTFYGNIIDFTSTVDQDNFQYLSTTIYTDASEEYSLNKPITFNQVGLLNSWQSTGLINLNSEERNSINRSDSIDNIVDKTTSIDLTKGINTFSFNEIFDYTQSHGKPNIEFEDCNIEPILKNYGDYSDRNNQDYKDRIVSDNYLYYRFIYNKFAKIKLYLKKIDTFITRNTNNG